MFPYKDENPTELTPVVTLGIIAVNAMVWLLVQGLGADESLARSVCQLGLIPGEVLRTVPPGTSVPLGPGVHCVLTADAHWSTVLTSMFMHGGWFHIIGNMWFLWVFGNNIEDSMGHARFVVFYPRVRVHTLVTLGFFVTTVTLPAYVMLGYWFVLQLLMGAVGALSPTEGGVAVWAHVGGFLTGLLLVKLFANPEFLERRRAGVFLPRDA